jgi:peroxiredoxin
LIDPDGKVVKVWGKISPKKNVPEVIKTLKSVKT